MRSSFRATRRGVLMFFRAPDSAGCISCPDTMHGAISAGGLQASHGALRGRRGQATTNPKGKAWPLGSEPQVSERNSPTDSQSNYEFFLTVDYFKLRLTGMLPLLPVCRDSAGEFKKRVCVQELFRVLGTPLPKLDRNIMPSP